MARDMTAREFRRSCNRRGFHPVGLGFYSLADTPLYAWARNGGPRLRDQLTYLIHEREKWLNREAETASQQHARES